MDYIKYRTLTKLVGEELIVIDENASSISFAKEEFIYMGDRFREDKDYENAVIFYSKAVKLRDDVGYERMGDCYFYGLGVKTDEKRAIKYYEKAAELGNGSACATLGHLYYNGEYVRANKKQAISYYEKGAMYEDGEACRSLAEHYYEGDGVETDYSKAFELFKMAIKYGDDYAYVGLGDCYYHGNGIKKDYKKAYECYQLFVDEKRGNLSYVAERLGDCYYYGNGVAQNYVKAVKLYEEGVAWYKLGTCYYEGKGVKKDYNKAIEYYKDALLLEEDEEMSSVKKQLEILEYKNAELKLYSCLKQIAEKKENVAEKIYNEAMRLYQAKEYEAAKIGFEQIENYRISSIMKEACELKLKGKKEEIENTSMSFKSDFEQYGYVVEAEQHTTYQNEHSNVDKELYQDITLDDGNKRDIQEKRQSENKIYSHVKMARKYGLIICILFLGIVLSMIILRKNEQTINQLKIYESEEDYESIIKYVQDDLNEEKISSDIKRLYEKAVDNYKSDITKEANDYVEQGEYEYALQLLEEACELINGDKEFEKQMLQINQLKVDADLELIGEVENIEQLENAINILEKAGDYRNLEQNSLYEQYINEYKELIIKTAENVYQEKGYLEAIEEIEKGLLILCDDEELLGLIKYYESMAPVALTHIEPFYTTFTGGWDGGEKKIGVVLKDKLGNEYSNCIEYPYGAEDSEDIYVLGKVYKEFKGTIFVPESRNRRGDDFDNSTAYDLLYFSIYGDGKLLYKSPKMGIKSYPVEFEISVSDIEQIMLRWDAGSKFGDCEIALTNAYLYR